MLINISRRNSIVLGLAIIVLFFVAGIVMLMFSRTSIQSKKAEIASSSESQEEVKPDLTAPITMNHFERHHIRDGKKQWEITAEKGRYVPLSNMADLEDSKLLFYRKDDSVIQLTAATSKVSFSGTELKTAELFGGVELIYNDKVKIQAESAVYNKEEDLIRVPGEVKILSENVDLSGTDLTAYVSKHEVTIAKDVSTTIKPKRK